MKLQLIPAVTHQKRTNNHFSLLSSNYTLKKQAIPATLTRQEKTVKEVMLKHAQHCYIHLLFRPTVVVILDKVIPL